MAGNTFLNFDYTPTSIRETGEAARAEYEKQLAKIAAVAAGTRTFENTVLALENAGADYSDAIAVPGALAYFSPDPAVRDAAAAFQLETSRFGIEVSARRDIYAALCQYAGSKPTLQPDERRLLDQMMLDFKRGGLQLADQDLENVKALRKELAAFQIQFTKNLAAVKDGITLPADRLGGLPETYTDGLERRPDGTRFISLDYPDYLPFMDDADDAEARRELEFKFNNRCAQDNVALLEKTLRLRHQIAVKLGYRSHAHFMLEDRMAKTPQTVELFLDNLRDKLRGKAQDELREMKLLKNNETGQGGSMAAWEWRYWNNKIKKTCCHVDHAKIKEYFPVQAVTQGLLSLCENLFEAEFRRAELPVWHPDVQAYELREKKSGALTGCFYLDLYPRDGKYKHAACFALRDGRALPGGQYQKPCAAIVANFPKPAPNAPSLLTHDDVQTLFHEFGHVIHTLFTTARFGRFSGTAVARDFVEVPSMTLEEWAWEPAVLKAISSHYKDPAAKLPDSELDRLVAHKNSDAGLTRLRQLFFSLLDMKYHLAETTDTTALYEQLMKKISLIPMTPGTHPQAGFGHLMGGYDAGYYGYLWAAVIAADIFGEFKRTGVFSPQTGRKFRDLILAPGRSEDEVVQVEKFLGRPANDTAFIKGMGL
ncbi:MAG: Zn-dependent oligopeptidase [Elusimicrobiaceae bacterium]|nr:Zn-dependent oligopeptidase [Elusimicrobiaceae bacterium]